MKIKCKAICFVTKTDLFFDITMAFLTNLPTDLISCMMEDLLMTTTQNVIKPFSVSTKLMPNCAIRSIV